MNLPLKPYAYLKLIASDKDKFCEEYDRKGILRFKSMYTILFNSQIDLL